MASAQFAPLDRFSAALVGWFWKGGYLSEEWTQVAEASRLEDQFEKFDGKGGWTRQVIRLRPPGEPGRVQLIHRDGARMIQVQNSRFIFNWRKEQGIYPGHVKLAQEFRDLLATFQAFLRDAGFPDGVRLNQWEVTYVNHIPKGELWDTPKDWVQIFPRLYYPMECQGKMTLDSMGGNWRYDIDNKARLHIALEHAKLTPPDSEGGEVLALTLTARGPVGDNGMPLDVGLNFGHDAIVSSFVGMTSSEAHRHWDRRV